MSAQNVPSEKTALYTKLAVAVSLRGRALNRVDWLAYNRMAIDIANRLMALGEPEETVIAAVKRADVLDFAARV